MKKIKFILPIILLTTFIISFSVNAANFGIVAVVNNEVITNHQLQNRITLAIQGSKLKDTPETRKRLALQMLESLIDEALQRQAAKRAGISITDSEFERSKRSIEQQNGLPPGEFDQFFKKFGINKDAFIEQMKAQLLWQKIILKALQPKVFVTTEESDEFAQRMIDRNEQEEFLISEILIPVLVPEQENDAKELANKLYEQIQEGANFSLFAKQFSRSSTAENGGEIGWVAELDIERKLRNKLSELSPGGITEPVRTGSGYLIMQLNDRRKTDKQATPDMVRIRDFLARQKIDLEARKFMKDLRRSAYIERRI